MYEKTAIHYYCSTQIITPFHRFILMYKLVQLYHNNITQRSENLDYLSSSVRRPPSERSPLFGQFYRKAGIALPKNSCAATLLAFSLFGPVFSKRLKFKTNFLSYTEI